MFTVRGDLEYTTAVQESRKFLVIALREIETFLVAVLQYNGSLTSKCKRKHPQHARTGICILVESFLCSHVVTVFANFKMLLFQPK